MREGQRVQEKRRKALPRGGGACDVLLHKVACGLAKGAQRGERAGIAQAQGRRDKVDQAETVVVERSGSGG